MIHDGKERRARGGGGRWWKVFGYIQSQCAAFCVAFKVTKMDMEREMSLFSFFLCVFFVLTSPSLYSWNWRPGKHCSSGRCAHNPLIQSQTRSWTALQTHIWLFVRGQIQNTKLIILPWECFSFYYFFNFKQSLKIKKCSYLNSVWK